MTLRFLASGSAHLLRNGELERVVEFRVRPSREGAGLALSYEEPLMGFETQTATFPDDETLVLVDPCCDGFVYRFTRAP